MTDSALIHDVVRCSMLTTELRGRMYPNGEFGISRVQRSRIPRFNKNRVDEGEDFNARALGVHGMQSLLAYKRSSAAEGCPVPLETSPLNADPIDLSNVSNSHKPRRGMNGITRHGSRLVRNAAFIMEKREPRGTLSFLTLTLPSLSEEHWKMVCDSWSEIVRQLVQWLRRRLSSFGLPGEIVGVTEIQEKRAIALKGIGLHLHLVFKGALRPWQWKITPLQIREAWKRLVCSCSLVSEADYNWEATENLTAVRSSAAGYLGKYMSKGVSTLRRLVQIYTSLSLPPTWYTCTTILRRRVLRLVLTLDGNVSRWLSEIPVDASGDVLLFRRDILLEIPGISGKIWLGCHGRVSPSLFVELRRRTRDEKKNVLLSSFPSI